jgi:hypothetical protein
MLRKKWSYENNKINKQNYGIVTIVIILTILSVTLCPKEITLSSFPLFCKKSIARYCTQKYTKKTMPSDVEDKNGVMRIKLYTIKQTK